MVTKRFGAFVVLLVAFLFAVNGVSAATIYSNNFGSSLGSEWTTSGDASVVSGALRLRDGAYAIVSRNTSGYENIELRYNRTTDTMEFNDFEWAEVDWRVGSSGSWNSIEWITQTTGWATKIESLSGAENKSLIQIRFRISGTDNTNDNFRIDNFLLSGDAYIIAYPTCNVDSLRDTNSNLLFNLTQNPFISLSGNYNVWGFSNSGHSSCSVSQLSYNYTGYSSWINANYQNIGKTIWSTNNHAFSEGNHTVCCYIASSSCENGCSVFENQSCITFCIDETAINLSGVQDDFVSDCGGDKNYVNRDFIYYNWSVLGDIGCAGVDYYNVTLYRNGAIVGGAQTTNLFHNFSGLPEGEYYAEVFAVDLAGNVGNTVVSGNVTVDLTDPVVNIWNLDDDGWVNSDFYINETDVDANLNSGMCYIRVRNDNVFLPGMYNISVPCNLAYLVNVSQYCPVDGECTIFKRAYDYACNYNPTESTSVTVDRTPPVTSKTPSGNFFNYTSSSTWQLIWNSVTYYIHYFLGSTSGLDFVGDDGAGIGCNATYVNVTNSSGLVDSFVFDGCSDSVSMVDDYIDGVYNITYYSVDNLGNIEIMQTETDKVDTEGPTTIKTIGSPNYSNGYYISWSTPMILNGTDSEVGCNYTNWKIINETGIMKFNDVDGCNAVVNWSELADGNYTINFSSMDHLGNWGNVTTQTHVVDNTPPMIEIDNPNLLELNRTQCYLNVVATVRDEGSGLNTSTVKAEVRNATNDVTIAPFILNLNYPLTSGYSNTVDTTGLTPGNYTLYVYASDNLNNTNVVSRNFTVNPGIFVQYVNPYSCSVPIGQSGSCFFTYRVCVRGSDQINMYIEKLGPGHDVDPGSIDASLVNSFGSAQVGVWETDGSFKHATNLSIASDNCTNVNGWVNFNLTMDLDAQDTTILGGNYQVNYTLNSFDNFNCSG